MRGLNARLRAVAICFRSSQRFANGAQCSLGFENALLDNGNRRAERLQAVLTLDHTSVLIGATTDAQPGLANPFATACDNRLPRGERRPSLESFAERFRDKYISELSSDGTGAFDFGQEPRSGPISQRAA